MSDGPKLDLPQYTPARAAANRTVTGGLTVVLIVGVLVLQVWTMYRSPAQTQQVSPSANASDPDLEKRMAMKLEERNLSGPAIEAWQRYLVAARPVAAEAGKIYYRIGRLHQQAEQYDDAVADFYRAEALLGDQAGDLAQKITMRVRECLQRRGQYIDLSRELAERSEADGSTQPANLPIVAEIGGGKITTAEFDHMLTEQIDQAVAMNPGISADQADELRKQAAARLADPSAKIQQLQQIVVNRVAAVEARARHLDQDTSFRRRLADLQDNLLASRLLLDEVSRRAVVTPEDIERFYKANADAYSEPTQVTIAHILVDSESRAKDLISKVHSGESFEDLAKSESLDAETRDHGGRIDQRVAEEGEYVPQVGQNSALHAAIMAAAENTVLAIPYKSDRGWHVIKIIKREPGRVLPFDEVRDEVEADARQARRQEVLRQYVQELFDKYHVKLYPQVLAAQAKGQPSNG